MSPKVQTNITISPKVQTTIMIIKTDTGVTGTSLRTLRLAITSRLALALAVVRFRIVRLIRAMFCLNCLNRDKELQV